MLDLLRDGYRVPPARGLTALVAAVLLAAACVPQPARETPPGATPSGAPSPPASTDWSEHRLAGSDVWIALPRRWLVVDHTDLADRAVRRDVEADYAGAGVLFGQLDAQGRRAPLVLLGVDPREAGTGRFPVVVTVVQVEPALPSLLLGIGADFAVDAFERTFELESDVTRSTLDTPLGDAIRLQFVHRLVGAEGGPGIAVEHDGAIVTTGEHTFLVSRNVDPGTAPADAPTLEAILATLRVET